MSVKNPKSKVIVIDTTSYSGNFERELCAHVTGQYGECGVGSALAWQAKLEISNIAWWGRHTQNEADDRGTLRPTSIWPTPGWFNNGSGGHYVDDPSNYDAAVAAAVEFTKRYHADHEVAIRERLANRNFEPAEKLGAWTEEACLRTLASNEAHVRQIAASRTRYPAYLSVAIFVDEFPPEDVLEEMQERASDFCANPQHFASSFKYGKDPRIELTGFRLHDPELAEEQKPSV
ncbi:hypothetical protein G6L37_00755 [Agrobacterium rubi]|nr:hypothetical protein [Agrobacterium rubi]NTF23920.1 hypothetical protein [Agrobacterium rubi]